MTTLRSAYAVRRPVVNVYLVRERDRRRLRELGVVLGAVLSLLGALVGYTWIHVEVLEAGYRIVALEERLERLAQEERRLRLETAHLASPRRVERLAVEELGMQAPAVEQVIFWEELPLPAGAPPWEPRP